jgi:ATP-dependent helicase/nuclease subunit B
VLLAPAGRGKTAYALARIRAVRQTEPLSPIWVVLPNRPQANAFRRRLAATGGALGIWLGTFYSVYADLLARAGQPAPRLLEPVQHRLLRAIVDRLAAAGRLRHFAPLRDKPGFIHALRALIQELKQARIEPPDLAAAVALGQDAPHLHDLAAIYTDYQTWLVDTGWVDAEGQGWLAAIALEAHPHLAGDLRLLVVDGFDEFNPTQLAVLKLLAGRAAETLVLLTGDPARARLAHRRFTRAIQAVTDALHVAPQPLADLQSPNLQSANLQSPNLQSPNLQSTTSQPLAHLEATLFEPAPAQQPAGDAVTFIEAQNRAQEVRAALRWVKARLVRDRLSPDEIAVLARDLSPYHPFLTEIAGEFGLPLRIDLGDDLAANPTIATLMALLALPVQDWPRRLVLDAWRSPYFDWTAQSIAPADAARLDAAARAGQVIGGLSQWREALARLKDAAPGQSEAIADEDLPPADIPVADEAAALRARFDAFVARVAPPPAAAVRDYVTFIEDLIGDDPTLPRRYPASSEKPDDSLRLVARALQARATADRDVAALRAFKDVLRGLALAEATLAEREAPSPLPYERFYHELQGAIKVATYCPPAPEGVAPVLVAPVLRARGLSFRAIVLLGLAEGEFPRAEHEDLLLRDADRVELDRLGLRLEPRLRGDETTIFYEAITLAREKLLLTRPYLAGDGQQWEASPYWQQVRRRLDAPVQTVRPQDPLSPRDAASPPELIASIAARPAAAAALTATGDDWARAWQRAAEGAAVLRARQSDAAAGPHEGDLASLAPHLAQRYGPTHVWSASRLEAYAACPLHFLLLHDLLLEPRAPPQEGFDVLTLGSMYHQVLETVYRRSPDDPLAALETVAQEVFDAAPERYGFRPTALWQRQKTELTRILAKTIAALIQASQGYEPLAQEQPFGMRGCPPLVVPTGDGDELRLRGFIDRLDRDASGGVRVVDYKAGSTLISANEITAGQRVQLPLYALAVCEALGLGEVSGGFYWHVASAQASSFKLEKIDGGVRGAIRTALAYTFAYVTAIRRGQFAPHPPDKGCPAHCPATAFCWRYTPRQSSA